jgi:glycerol-3-phosphate dehydrogenase
VSPRANAPPARGAPRVAPPQSTPHKAPPGAPPPPAPPPAVSHPARGPAPQSSVIMPRRSTSRLLVEIDEGDGCAARDQRAGSLEADAASTTAHHSDLARELIARHRLVTLADRAAAWRVRVGSNSPMASGSAQVAVIGGGVVGCAVVHALARRGVPVTLLEAQPALASGASAANSGILHSGFDSPPGELETRLILRAAQLREQLMGELGVEVWRCGALLRPRDEREQEAVARLERNARCNGVEVARERAGALRVPGEAVSDPLAFVQALAAAARAGGADIVLGARVSGLEPAGGETVRVLLAGGARIEVRVAVNCAGLHADEVARMAGEERFAIYPRKGEFLVFAAPAHAPLEEILLPVPSALGKGVLVFPTLDRHHVIAGPTAREREDKCDWSVEEDARELILARAARMYPPLEHARLQGAYAGLRPAGRNGANYLIERSRTLPGLVHVAAIRSTGLSAAPAIGEYVVAMLAQEGRIEPRPAKPRFGPTGRVKSAAAYCLVS